MVRAVQKGDLALSEVSPDVQRAAKRMKPSDARDFAHTKHKGLPEHKEEDKKASALDLLGLAWLMHKSADATQLTKTVDNVAKSIQQLGVNRRKQLEKDLKQMRQHLQKAQQGHADMQEQLKAHETGLEDKKLELEAAANEKRLHMELEAEERRHEQRTRHEQQKAQMDLQKSVQQSQVEAEMNRMRMEAEQKQMEALNGPPGVQAPTGQVPYGQMLSDMQGDEEEGKGKKPKR